MRTNTTKAKLAEGKAGFGAIISRHAPDLVELFGAIGYDFVMIDCEHGPMDLDQVEHMVRAAEVFGITPITRIPNHEDSTILRFLDRGVQGIIVPHINTRETAAAVARAARYYPEGYRGVGGGRAHDYGVGVSRDESTRWVNSQLLVIPMIEETEAVDNLDAILKVSGVDVLHVAASDLGQSMGNPGATSVRQVMRQVIPRIRARDKLVGGGGNAPGEKAIIEQGGACMIVELDLVSRESIARAFETIRTHAGDPEVLVYNAGYLEGRDLPPDKELLEHVPVEMFETAQHIASRGPFLVAQEVLPAMRRRGSGSFLISNNQFSLRGRTRLTGQSLYYPRVMMRTLAQVLTEEYSEYGVHVANVVIGGLIDSPGTRALPRTQKNPEIVMNPVKIAEAFYYLHTQDKSCWTHELQLTPVATKPSF